MAFAVSSAGIYAVLTVALFGDVLLAGPSLVLSGPGSDIAAYFFPLREFGFRELRAGNFPLWDPYTHSGRPYAANFQAALFYPGTWLHLALPAATAFNWIFALHWFVAAWLTALWCRCRGVGTAGALLGGLVFACSGSFFLRIYAGHVTMFCAAAWIPLIFCAADAMVVRRQPRWLLAGIPAAAMTLLAGYPQIFYYAAVATGVFTLAHLRREWRDVAQASALLAAMFLGGALLAGVQLLPGLALASESTRSKGLSYGFAAMFALPPENLITAFAPGFFGPPDAAGYVGRSYLWEASTFVGAAAFVLALEGALGVPGGRRLGLVVATLVLLALGPAVPLFQLLYEHLPGYGVFRATARFTLMAAPVIALLAALGCDRAARGVRVSRRRLGAFAAGALLVAALGLWLRADAAGEAKGLQLLQAAALFGVTAAVLALARRWPRVAVLAGLIAAAELLVVARGYRATSSPTVPYFRAWAQANRVAPDDRFLHAALGNFGLLRGVSDANGYDPTALARYARFLAASQGIDAATIDWAPTITTVSPMFETLRVRHVMLANDGARVVTLPNPMPRLSLIGEWRLAAPDDALAIMSRDGEFDPRRTVLLETPPDPPPSPGSTHGSARVVRSTASELEIEADLASPTLLLITDPWAEGWRVAPLSPGPQRTYGLLPADTVLRALPLAAGRHHVVLRYEQRGLLLGALLTLSTLVGLLIAAGRSARR